MVMCIKYFSSALQQFSRQMVLIFDYTSCKLLSGGQVFFFGRSRFPPRSYLHGPKISFKYLLTSKRSASSKMLHELVHDYHA